MRVAILGHRGFVGSTIANHFHALGIRVVGIDRENYLSVRGETFDVFINAAGSSDKRLAEADPRASFHANVVSTMASLADFRSLRYLLISSVNVYHDLGEPSRNREDSPIDLLSLPPYGFQKFLAEALVRKHAGTWLIFRLGPLVGPGMRRNAIFDLLTRRTIFVSPRSTFCYIDTRQVARLVWQLRDEVGHIFNVAGSGSVRLADLAAELGVDLAPELYRLPEEHYQINIDKVSRLATIPDSYTAVREVAAAWASPTTSGFRATKP